MCKSDERIKVEHSILKKFPFLYAKLKRLENRIKLDKKEIHIHDLNELNISIHTLEKEFISFRKILYPSKEEEN